jgi:hypothetical protein
MEDRSLKRLRKKARRGLRGAWRERRIAPVDLAGLAEEPTDTPRSSETDTTAAPPPPARPQN